MDVLTIQWGWIGGKKSGITPPVPVVSTNVMIGGTPIQDPNYRRKREIWEDEEEFIARQLYD
jgi:hypothetical protein